MSEYATYETSQPWAVYHYVRSDAEAERLGEALIVMECCICGEREDARFPLPPLAAPPPPPGYRHPQREAFLAKHQHPLQRTAPETWALPLRNPAAHGDTLDILRDVAEKARHSADQT